MDHDKTELHRLQGRLVIATECFEKMAYAHSALLTQADGIILKIAEFKKQMDAADAALAEVFGEIEKVIAGRGLDPRTIEVTLKFIRNNPGVAKSQLGYRCRKYATLNLKDKEKLLKRFVDDGLIEIRNVLKTEKSTNPAAHLYPTQYSKIATPEFDY